MNVGKFSMSLTVKDIKASREFYEILGFKVIDGDEAQNWLILRQGETTIGLFQEMFPKNMLTFVPKDVRAIQAELKSKGIELLTEAEGDEGPASITLQDPDGNPILFDQHPEDYKPKVQEPAGKVAWVDLTVPNAENVRDFYTAVVGWESTPVSQGDYDDYNMMRGDTPVTGICHKKRVIRICPANGWCISPYQTMTTV